MSETVNEEAALSSGELLALRKDKSLPVRLRVRYGMALVDRHAKAFRARQGNGGDAAYMARGREAGPDGKLL
ncbi:MULTISPECIES: hypothetical protein [unclassified Caballeronia]|uniref:hypothetical protein n=1 Tax=unclassified Caballeronia TaxID=2646786 RepID=UPI002860EB13|nr:MULTISPECIES: hypothetical protein [unclassified Caballeronia]MDR5751084.1 hypothetical protein [Caballeronia sp. LZ024]MDR5844781.1 hypothetical protein [Caballeronia sp. LZ031]